MRFPASGRQTDCRLLNFQRKIFGESGRGNEPLKPRPSVTGSVEGFRALFFFLSDANYHGRVVRN
jgi:hypothetical protein